MRTYDECIAQIAEMHDEFHRMVEGHRDGADISRAASAMVDWADAIAFAFGVGVEQVIADVNTAQAWEVADDERDAES